MKFLKKNLLISVAAVLFLGSKVKAETDCEYLEKAIKYLNDDIRKHFKIEKCCDFNGVRCDSKKNIREIKFNNVNKTKDFEKFVDKISNIKNLNYLDLANDNIEGSIPKSICSITSLKNLNLSKNKLKGAIPYNCTLENLEQLNLAGNKDLTGYIPIFTKVRGCAFKETNLCDVPNSLCKNAPKNCTEEDYAKTNAVNGNPDKKSKTYIDADVKARDPSLYDNYNNYYYGYTGYNDYDNYGSYDLNNYYGDTGYGYGYGDWGYYNGYDNSYYDNGYYGTGYDGYTGFGYDTSFYDNGYYTNYYDPSMGYGTYDYPSGTTGSQGTYYGRPNAHSGAFRNIDAGKFFLSMIVTVFLIALRNF